MVLSICRFPPLFKEDFGESSYNINIVVKTLHLSTDILGSGPLLRAKGLCVVFHKNKIKQEVKFMRLFRKVNG